MIHTQHHIILLLMYGDIEQLTDALWYPAIPEKIDAFDELAGVRSRAVVQVETVIAADISVECVGVDKIADQSVFGVW